MINWDDFAKDLLKDLSQKFDDLHAFVGHVKLILESGKNFIMGNLTGKGDSLNFRGSAGTSNQGKLILNARVEMSPVLLEQIVKESIASKGEKIKAKTLAFKCLSPGRPKPNFRFDHVVNF